MRDYYINYLKEIKEAKRNECNQLLKYILKFTDTNHRWEGSLNEFINRLGILKERLCDECNMLSYYNYEYIFETEVKKIRSNLNVRGIKVFISRKNGEMHIIIDKDLENIFQRNT